MLTKTLSIRAKLTGAFGTLAALLIALGLFGLYATSSLNGLLLDVNTHWMPSVRAAGEMNGWTGRYTINLFRHVLNTDAAAKARIEAEGERRAQKVEEAARTYEALISLPEERKLYETFRHEWQSFLAEVELILAFSRRNENEKARETLDIKATPHQVAAFQAIENLIL